MNQPLTKLQTIESRIDTAKVEGTALSSETGGLSFQNVTEAMEFAKLMAISDIGVRKHLRGNPGACLGVLIQAVEWGLSPYQVANRSYLVNDQIAYESSLIQAVILKRAPIKGRIKFDYEGEGDRRVCIASAVDLDGDTLTYRSPELSKISPKNSPLWKSDPDQQMAYMSGRSLCRRHFPDVLLGIYDREELEGAEGINEVNQRPSGLAARLGAAKADNGFNADAVGSALGGEKAEVTVEAEIAKEEAPAATEQKTAETTPDIEEARRQGNRAALAGDDREAPEDAHPDEQTAWLEAFDKTTAEANAS